MEGIASQEGVLEVDLHRGVVWFTPTKGKWRGATTLRICGLPKGLNIERDQQDVTVTDYIGKETNDTPSDSMVHADGKGVPPEEGLPEATDL